MAGAWWKYEVGLLATPNIVINVISNADPYNTQKLCDPEALISSIGRDVRLQISGPGLLRGRKLQLRTGPEVGLEVRAPCRPLISTDHLLLLKQPKAQTLTSRDA